VKYEFLKITTGLVRINPYAKTYFLKQFFTNFNTENKLWLVFNTSPVFISNKADDIIVQICFTKDTDGIFAHKRRKTDRTLYKKTLKKNRKRRPKARKRQTETRAC